LTEIVRADHGDIEALAETLSRAFHADPVSAYLFPNASRRKARLDAFFRLQIERVYLPRGEVYTTTDRRAAALWLPPGTRAPGFDVQWAYLVLAMRSRSFRRGRRLAIALFQMRPRESHYYLGTIGTDPDYQGQGLGSALIGAVLARLDATAMPAYLEASTEPNVRFYTGLGFRVLSEIKIKRGPTLWTMWRDPIRN
jgi:ribosomal protein S18 acetylase RimI-like enzyme